MSRKILIIGATSAIAEACAKLFAQQGASLYLLARNTERLEALGKDLKVRGALQLTSGRFDINALETHDAVLSEAITALGGIDLVLIAHGTLANQAVCEQDVTLTLQELQTNAMSTIALLTRLANIFEKQQQGTIAVISSVAGDRGRQSNYVYGTAKGAVSIFLQGLRNRLYKAGVQVLTIKPGFVDTPMTSDREKGFLWASPEKIAAGIIKALDKKSDVVYLPWFWKYIMLIIKLIPERIFKKLIF